jgi:hypothetical protein
MSTSTTQSTREYVSYWFHSYLLTLYTFSPSHEETTSLTTSVPHKSLASTDNAVVDGATLTTGARISGGAIAGAIVAGIAALVLVFFLTLYWDCQPWGSEEGSVEDARIAGVELKSWDIGAI